MAEEGGACHMVGGTAAFLFQAAARPAASSAGHLLLSPRVFRGVAWDWIIGWEWIIGLGLRGQDAASSLPVVGRRFLSLLGNNGEDNGCLSNVSEQALG